jgi:hypothetical protein
MFPHAQRGEHCGHFTTSRGPASGAHIECTRQGRSLSARQRGQPRSARCAHDYAGRIAAMTAAVHTESTCGAQRVVDSSPDIVADHTSRDVQPTPDEPKAGAKDRALRLQCVQRDGLLVATTTTLQHDLTHTTALRQDVCLARQRSAGADGWPWSPCSFLIRLTSGSGRATWPRRQVVLTALRIFGASWFFTARRCSGLTHPFPPHTCRSW